MTDNSKLTAEQFDLEYAKLGPRPPWWRPFKLRRWLRAEYELCQRRADYPEFLARVYAAIKELPDDSRRRR